MLISYHFGHGTHSHTCKTLCILLQYFAYKNASPRLGGSNMKKFIIVEDDKSLNNGICIALQSNEFTFLPCETIHKAKEIYKTDTFSFDFSDMKFYKGELEIDLSKTEQKLLKLLVSHPHATFERSMLVDRI